MEYIALHVTFANCSDAFNAQLCMMWQGQPMKYIAGVFCTTLVMMEFLTPRLTDVLSVLIPIQFSHEIWYFCNVSSILLKIVSALPQSVPIQISVCIMRLILVFLCIYIYIYIYMIT